MYLVIKLSIKFKKKIFFLWLLFQKILKLACCKKISPPMNLLNKTYYVTHRVKINFYLKISNKNKK